MNNESTILISNPHSLNEKVEFLSHAEAYPDTNNVEVKETHMSWVFLTDRFVYKMKKPVHYRFLDFRTLESRFKNCTEEVRLNKRLAKDIYLGVVPLVVNEADQFELNGKGRVIDWLVWMKRLPKEHMLDKAIQDSKIKNERVQQTAEILADFYIASSPVKLSSGRCRQQLMADVGLNTTELLKEQFKLSHTLIVSIDTNLLHFIVNETALFEKRIEEGRIIEAHGDLRPEHICLASQPVIIDCLEFNRGLRIMDVAEELSFLAMECEVLGAHATGQLFFNIYKWKSHDKIPEGLIFFYKAKRAFLRAQLSIHHLLEDKYQEEQDKWRGKCEMYLSFAQKYCEQFPKKN